MPTLKSIPQGGFRVTPVHTHKLQHYEYEFEGVTNPETIRIDVATKPPTNLLSWNLDTGGVDNDQILYASLKHMFYSEDSVWSNGKKLDMPSTDTVYVISAVQKTYGSSILPNSVVISDNSVTKTCVDDGDGNLIFKTTGTILGHVFYEMGIMVLQKGDLDVIDATGVNLTTGTILDIEFKATHTIYEYSAMCTMDIGEMSFTLNPSVEKRAASGEIISDSFVSGSMYPYMTTIGLYNNQNELVAIGKFPRPIKRAIDSQQTVIVKWDI